MDCVGWLGLLLLVGAAPGQARCVWPESDVLFLLDSTVNADSANNHRKMLDFVKAEARLMRLSPDDSQLALAQFTPTPTYEIPLSSDDFDIMERRINVVPYTPCQAQGEQCTRNSASLNTLVKGGLSRDEGNRLGVPDVVVVISTSLYQPRELNPGELLVQPRSPTHVFLITVGAAVPAARYIHNLQFAATTTNLAALDFNALSQLEGPLCESVTSFVVVEMAGNVLGWWHYLQWNVSSCSKTNDLNTVYWTFACNANLAQRNPLKPTLCIVIIILTAVIGLVLVMCMCYAVYYYKTDVKKVKSQLRAERENLNKLTEYYSEKLRQRSVNEKEREKTMMELINESNRLRDHYRDDVVRREQSMPLPVTVVPPDDEITVDDATLATLARSHSYPAPAHVARLLPPVDVLLLIDSSSSIGLNSFNMVKQVLRAFVADIDIAPNRSRVCAVLFASEPKVYFGFDRYYSIRSVRTAIRRMPYLGGPTYLAKALSFAAGILYQEQNMKTVRHKHRSMPTPRHDRPQVMVVVSDGISDDNFDQEATHLHERLQVKIAALVTKSFNRERMVPVTRYDGAVFTMDQKEALSIWLWRTQRLWNENFGGYVEREKSFGQTPRRAR